MDAITIAADDLTQALSKPEAKKSLTMLPKHYEALQKLTEVFNEASKQQPMILNPTPPPILMNDKSKFKENKIVSNDLPPKMVPKAKKPHQIPFKKNEYNKFSKFQQRPATNSYNTRKKNIPHIIPVINNVVNDKRKKMSYKKLIQSNVKDQWVRAMIKELGRISQGYRDLTTGTDTVRFMTPEEVNNIPKNKTVTYTRITADYREEKKDPYRVRITVGGILSKTQDQPHRTQRISPLLNCCGTVSYRTRIQDI